jgi:hypothetical protein
MYAKAGPDNIVRCIIKAKSLEKEADDMYALASSGSIENIQRSPHR